jgi:hypothetical protein
MLLVFVLLYLLNTSYSESDKDSNELLSSIY